MISLLLIIYVSKMFSFVLSSLLIMYVLTIFLLFLGMGYMFGFIHTLYICGHEN